MTEKIGLIKNPLTIIAIFAGIAEVSGTIVLPFIAEKNQELFIHFLIFFPSILVLMFFITLNFNNKVLYAPSDYKDEMNYVKINKYDVSRQRHIEFKVPKDDQNQQVIQLTDKVEYLSTQILKLETLHITKDNQESRDNTLIKTIGLELLVSNFENAGKFVAHMKTFGVDFNIYHSPGLEYQVAKFNEHKAIWLGTKIPLETTQFIVKKSKEFYPHLKYLKLSEAEWNEGNQIYIGGSSESAVSAFNCVPLKDSDFEQLNNFRDLSSLHKFILQFGT